MAISRTEDLFDLIKSLTKAEKRSFRLFAERISSSENLSYMKLFDIIDRLKSLDEKEIKSKLGKMTTVQYSNVKRHLYEQILISLRLVHKSKRMDVKIREMLDYTYILYGKGLHLQALKTIQRAKKMARNHQRDSTLLTIMEVEKMIHSRHITRTKDEFIQEIVTDSDNIANQLLERVQLSNLRILMHKFYIENGHVTNQEEANKISEFFQSHKSSVDESLLGQTEKVHLYQSYVWYYYILNDFENCFIYSKKWIDLFEEDTQYLARDVNLLFRGYHYLLTSLYNLKDTDRYSRYYNLLEKYRKDNYGKFNKNTQILSFLYVHQARLNYHFLQGTFDEGVKIIPKTIKRIDRYKYIMDDHKIMVLYFKISWMYLRNHEPQKALKYLQYNIDLSNSSLRQDIQAYSRLMFLMAHFDLGNRRLLMSLVRNYTAYFKRNEIQNNVQKLFLKFFNEISKAPLIDQKKIVLKYLDALKNIEDNEYEKRAFLYLDIISWLTEKK